MSERTLSDPMLSEPLPVYQVDAFTKEPFAGNPAAVCLYESWLPDELMQAIAMENNLSETAFLVPEGEDWGLRWFTPAVEVDLCGHATLAAACVLFADVETEAEGIMFQTRSGPLGVTRGEDGSLVLDFPAIPPLPVGEPVPGLAEALGAEPVEVHDAGHNLLAVFGTEAEVAALAPDFPAFSNLQGKSVIATAPGEAVDFVSRYFAPAVGVEEDPVTGSAHCTLAPYWADRLGRKRLSARQISTRGGELLVEDHGGRVEIAGHAVIVMRGEMLL